MKMTKKEVAERLGVWPSSTLLDRIPRAEDGKSFNSEDVERLLPILLERKKHAKRKAIIVPKYTAQAGAKMLAQGIIRQALVDIQLRTNAINEIKEFLKSPWAEMLEDLAEWKGICEVVHEKFSIRNHGE